jgi:large subunit ribosomal protein L4
MTTPLSIRGADGSSQGDFPLPEQWLEPEKGVQAVHDVVTAYLAGRRAGTGSTKTRAEVVGSSAKPWKQKGTGRARAGSRKSPVWVGGGIAFGPKPRSFAKQVNKKVRRLALRRTFTERLNDGAIGVVDQLALDDHKSRSVRALLKRLDLGDSVLIVVSDYDENLLRATGNFPEVLLIKAAAVNVYQLLRFKRILFTKDALEAFGQRLA